jgi:hypothetical protein
MTELWHGVEQSRLWQTYSDYCKENVEGFPKGDVDPKVMSRWLRIHGTRLGRGGKLAAAGGALIIIKAIEKNRTLDLRGGEHSRLGELGAVVMLGGAIATLGGNVNVDTASSIEAGERVGMGLHPDFYLEAYKVLKPMSELYF